MQFDLKKFLIFLLVFVGGSFAGGYVNSWLGIVPGSDLFSYTISIFVPVLIIYVVWQYYAASKKQA